MKNVFGKGFGKLKGLLNKQKQQENTSNTNENSHTISSNTNPSSESSENSNSSYPSSEPTNINNNQKMNPNNSASIPKFFMEGEEIVEPEEDLDPSFFTYVHTEPEEDYWRLAHRVLLKNSKVDISQIIHIPFIKLKVNENLFTKIGFQKKKEKIELNYFVCIDEHFIYMINMNIKQNNNDSNKKIVGNHFNLKKLFDIEIKKDKEIKRENDDNVWILIRMIFRDIIDGNNNTFKTKEMHFSKEDGIKFIGILKYYLKKFDIMIYKKLEKGNEKKKDNDNENNKENNGEEEIKENGKKEDKIEDEANNINNESEKNSEIKENKEADKTEDKNEENK